LELFGVRQHGAKSLGHSIIDVLSNNAQLPFLDTGKDWERNDAASVTLLIELHHCVVLDAICICSFCSIVEFSVLSLSLKNSHLFKLLFRLFGCYYAREIVVLFIPDKFLLLVFIVKLFFVTNLALSSWQALLFS